MHALADQRLSSAGRVLLLLGTLFIAGYTLSGMFVNVFIWKVDHSFVAIGWFNVSLYVSLPVGFLGAGYLATRMGELWMVRAGVVVLSVFFLTLLFLGQRSAHHVIWLGAFYGGGQGLYWYGFHVLTFDLTHRGNRARFNALAGVFATLVATIGPFWAGFVLADGRHYSGYHLIFGVSLALFAALFAVSFRIRVQRVQEPLRLGQGFRLRKDPDWRALLAAQVVFGIREGVFAFLIGLLVFFVSKSEVGLGEYALWTGILSLMAFYLAGRVAAREGRRRVALQLSGLCLAAVACVFLWRLTGGTMILYGIVTACSLPFVTVTLGVMQMNEIDESHETARHRSAHLIAREMALGVGRVLGVSTFLFVAYNWPGSSALVWLVAILGAAHAVVALVVRKVTFVARDGQDHSVWHPEHDRPLLDVPALKKPQASK